MFSLFKVKKKDPIRDMLVRDLMKAVMDFSDDYKKLMVDYKKLTQMYFNLSRAHSKLARCVINYLECGSSETFQLLLKEHAVGEEINTAHCPYCHSDYHIDDGHSCWEKRSGLN